MNLETLIGMFAGILTTIAFVPQVLQVYRSRSAKDISLGMYAIFVSGVLLWLVYGCMIGAMPVIVANGVTLLLAAAILIGSEAAGKTHGFTPRARIVAAALSGADPTIMLTGPMPAARKALAKAGMTVDQIDLFEVNEAFAAVPMRFMKEMGVPHEKVNVNGGAIAMGHPLGATGAMILNTLIDELHRRKLRYGLATLCVGGGMGIATIVEAL